MTTFPQFVATHPELTPFARKMFLYLNKKTKKAGAQVVAQQSIASLRMKQATGTPSLRGFRAAMANALERDPSGQLAAVPALYGWASTSGFSITWTNIYVAFYKKYLDHIKQPTQIAAE